MEPASSRNGRLLIFCQYRTRRVCRAGFQPWGDGADNPFDLRSMAEAVFLEGYFGERNAAVSALDVRRWGRRFRLPTRQHVRILQTIAALSSARSVCLCHVATVGFAAGAEAPIVSFPGSRFCRNRPCSGPQPTGPRWLGVASIADLIAGTIE